MVSDDVIDRERRDDTRRGVAAFLVFLLAVFSISVTVGTILEQTPEISPYKPATVYDNPEPGVIQYVEAYCPVCGHKAIASTESICCINRDCREYGIPHEW